MEVMSQLKELNAKMDSYAALRTKVNQLKQSLEVLHAEFKDSRRLSKQQAEEIKVLQ